MVNVDLSSFFDLVNHDILIDRLRKRVDNAGVIRLIRAYLNSGIMDHSVVQSQHEGTAQGTANLLAVSAAFLVGVGVGASETAPQKGAEVYFDLGDDEGKDRQTDHDCEL